ncbi:cysteine-rich CWC family protein [Massilia solisilvae]|uniref:Cysteine-rich CWC family protein n=1 Tax=Massilia solisilvae TaxID=1811225 RepID=A0ABT2BMW9_9BURK|nr:cysteine-rich CWC family protein [Massilia solisilvae]MCS0609863.1 cysteine-rich CWC family protein [Massilia solisilvae]
MSICTRCGAPFGCAMADGGAEPCWCTALPAIVPVPDVPAGCWCPACLERHVAGRSDATPEVPAPPLN